MAQISMFRRKKKLSCEYVQKNVHLFINDKLDSDDTIGIIEHLKECPDCMEEFSIEYLVIEGVNRLDNASSFHLQNELDNKLSVNEEHALFKKSISFWLFAGFIIIAIVGGYYISTLFYV